MELVARTPKIAGSVAPLPQLAETLLIGSRAAVATQEVPRATAQREALYDAVVQRFMLYDMGRLRGLEGRKAALDFDALGADAIPALVRGLNRSATLDASCPVMAISAKLGTLLGGCQDLDLIAEVRETIGKGVGPTPYHAYLTGLKVSCRDRLMKAHDGLKPRIPQLVIALKSKDALTRRKAANTLGLAGADAKAAIPELIAALKDRDPQVADTAARALAAIGTDADPALLRAADTGADRAVRRRAYLALGESRPANDSTVGALVAGLNDPDSEVHAAAALALSRLGDRAVTPLRQALKAKDPSAALALGQIGAPAANEAVPDLIAALNDDNRDLRVASHHALVRIGAPAVPALSDALKGADLRGWFSISLALGKIGPDARAAVPALSEGLGHKDRAIRLLAVSALVKIDPKNPAIKPTLSETVAALIDLLREPEGALREWAVLTIGQIGADAAAAVPALTARLTESDPSVRVAAAETLARLGKSAVPALIKALKDESPEIRSAAVDLLGRIGADAVPELAAATKGIDSQMRRAPCWPWRRSGRRRACRSRPW